MIVWGRVRESGLGDEMLMRPLKALSVLPLTLAACDSGPAPSPEAKTLHACFAKRGLTIEKYLVFATGEISYMLCSDRLAPMDGMDERGLALTAALAEFVIDEVPGSDCARARRVIIEPIRERTVSAYKNDGADAFCAWVAQMLTQKNPELWTRFWK
jgi:hypothetical protein